MLQIKETCVHKTNQVLYLSKSLVLFYMGHEDVLHTHCRVVICVIVTCTNESLYMVDFNNIPTDLSAHVNKCCFVLHNGFAFITVNFFCANVIKFKNK